MFELDPDCLLNTDAANASDNTADRPTQAQGVFSTLLTVILALSSEVPASEPVDPAWDVELDDEDMEVPSLTTAGDTVDVPDTRYNIYSRHIIIYTVYSYIILISSYINRLLY